MGERLVLIMGNDSNMIGDVPGVVLGTLSDIFLKVKNGSITPRHLELFAQGKNPFAGFEALTVDEWGRFYQDTLKFKANLDGLVMPPKPEGEWWSIIIPPKLMYNFTIKGLRRFFTIYLYRENLDAAIDMDKEQRRAVDKPYGVWVPANIEADEDMKGKPAEDLIKTPTIVLLERIVLEGAFYVATKQHLDIENVTLCASSRYGGGNVPSANWDGGEFSVYWCNVRDANSKLRARRVVSLPLSQTA